MFQNNTFLGYAKGCAKNFLDYVFDVVISQYNGVYSEQPFIKNVIMTPVFLKPTRIHLLWNKLDVLVNIYIRIG